MARRPHLFVDISAHGLGHLAQVAPVLNTLFRLRPNVRLTIRSAVPKARLRARLPMPFDLITARSDFGFIMQDATRLDLPASAQAYRDFHAHWRQRVTDEVRLQSVLAPDLVLTDVAYLPLAAAAQRGIPACAMCSLNWADLFAHLFGSEHWVPPIHAQILAAYRSAKIFFRPTPSMPMTDLGNTCAVGPVATIGCNRRAELTALLGLDPQTRLVLIGFGGFDKTLDEQPWPASEGIHWLTPPNWPNVSTSDCAPPSMTSVEALDWPFIDLLASVDAVLTKPGYGTFVEAACNGIPVIYLLREDWPEQDCLIDWLQHHARSAAIDEAALFTPRLAALLEALWRQPSPRVPVADGDHEIAAHLLAFLA